MPGAVELVESVADRFGHRVVNGRREGCLEPLGGRANGRVSSNPL
jgi:hypothetical protein